MFWKRKQIISKIEMGEHMVQNRLTVLVMSCDKYSDLWNPMSDFLRLFWADCPYEIVLSTETKMPKEGAVFTRTVHSKRPAWSGRVLDSLAGMDTPYVLFLLDDLWPGGKIDTCRLESLIDLMERDGIGDIHLRKEGADQKDYDKDADFRLYALNAPYRISASASLWNRNFLMSVMREEENAWDFERIGSFRDEGKRMPVLVCKESPFPIIDCAAGAVERGKWEPKALQFAAQNGVSVDTSHRSIKTRRDQVKVAIKSFLYNLNPGLILHVQNRIYQQKHRRAATGTPERKESGTDVK